jgi:coproporphyrinogen III oxidase
MQTLPIHEKKSLAAAWFRQLRDDICAGFEAIEAEHETAQAGLSPPSHSKFTRTPWQRPEGGGGDISLMKGRVFEKVGVNISTVEGEFSPAFRKEIPGAEANPHFWASGISLVAHMCSPLVPAAHFNTRMIVVGEAPARLWFGGGGDLNPMFPVAEDTAEFHRAFQSVCDEADLSFYPAFKDWCDEYFYIPHRKEPRGVGGIFYDYLGLNILGADKTPIAPGQFGRGGLGLERTIKGMEVASNATLSWDEAFGFTQKVGRAFFDSYTHLIRLNLHKKWTEEQRHHQLIKRGRYAEYNLLYDRGTKFGLMTGGNPEAILMSLPPVAIWE